MVKNKALVAWTSGNSKSDVVNLRFSQLCKYVS
jgi:hypothetical protein